MSRCGVAAIGHIKQRIKKKKFEFLIDREETNPPAIRIPLAGLFCSTVLFALFDGEAVIDVLKGFQIASGAVDDAALDIVGRQPIVDAEAVAGQQVFQFSRFGCCSSSAP